MKPGQDIKIKTLPRGPAKKVVAAKKTPLVTGIVGVLAVALIAFCLITPKHRTVAAKPKRSGTITQSSQAPNDELNQRIQEHMLEAQAKGALMTRQREVENMQFKDAAKEMGENQISMQEDHDYGVQLDQEDTADRVYEDLHGEPSRYSDYLPADKINARLANRQWVNEQERAERVAFVSNFIKSAYERGYEVDIDSNLVVTAVRKINSTQKVNINQVLDKLANQGI